ncbi:hypothetical protein GOP97_19700 [Vibrio cholerae]|uniref:hypothetical protein n=2 Tax=Vibrio TaxID=662 RepID=UPI001F03C311|nr:MULTISPECIES: hypothetical protein [Vibrio]MCG9655837.1 hypothetical protein [Vibrio vulnificus]MEB5557926.1 hypothetical protein [Vibrio cholerae]
MASSAVENQKGVLKMLFPELNAFALYSKFDVISFMNNELGDNNILDYLIENNGGELVEKGVLLPIFNVDDGLYNIDVIVNDGNGSQELGVFCSSGEVSVIGLGYLAEFDHELLCMAGKNQSFIVPNGTFGVSYCLNDIEENLTIYLNSK